MTMTDRLDSAHQVAAKPRRAKDPFYASRLRDLSVEVYSRIMESENPGAMARMAARDADGGLKIRNRALIYERVVRTVLEVKGIDL